MPIALDFGASSIKMLQLAGDPDHLRVRAAGRFDLPAGLAAEGPERMAVLVEGCRQLLHGSECSGRQAVIGLPDSAIQYKSIRMPNMPEAELAQAIGWEAGDRFQMANEKATYQHLNAGQVLQGTESRQEVILMAASDARLGLYLQVAQAAGLTPLAMEPTPVALARAVARLYRRKADQDLAHVAVDIGASASKIVILKGHQIVFYRRIDLGGHSLNKALADRLRMSPADAQELRRKHQEQAQQIQGEGQPLFGSARREDVDRAVYDATRTVMSDLAKEIGLCMRYYSVTFRGGRPDTLLACGGESSDARLIQVVAEQLELKIQPLEVFFGVDAGGSKLLIERRGTQAQWAAAMGLALRRSAVGALTERGAA